MNFKIKRIRIEGFKSKLIRNIYLHPTIAFSNCCSVSAYNEYHICFYFLKKKYTIVITKQNYKDGISNARIYLNGIIENNKDNPNMQKVIGMIKKALKELED